MSATAGNEVRVEVGADPASPIAAATATARFFKVLSDPTRLAILRLLSEREYSVAELVDILRVPQSRVSNHLACLRWCRLVEVTRESRRAIYRLADDRVLQLIKAVELDPEQEEHLASCSRIGPTWI
jgi:ArsR family transcriptional regulator, cadmium/lead-responsive transcriptional repressor